MSSITVSLSPRYDSWWKTCYSMDHEMITTTVHRRIFPTLQYSVSGLDPMKTYRMCMQLVRFDDKKNRYVGGKYVESESMYHITEPKKVWHQNGSQLGRLWLDRIISFDNVRITNQVSSEESNPTTIPLFSMHRYIPELLVYCGEELVHTERIPYTQFLAVTSYNNNELKEFKKSTNQYSTGSRSENRLRRREETTGGPTPKRPKTDIPQIPSGFQSIQALLANQMTSGEVETKKDEPCSFAFTPPEPELAVVEKFDLKALMTKNVAPEEGKPDIEKLREFYLANQKMILDVVANFQAITNPIAVDVKPESPSVSQEVITPPLSSSVSPIPFQPFFPFGYPFNPFLSVMLPPFNTQN